MRDVFSEFLEFTLKIDKDGNKYRVHMLDLSKTGCLFQVPQSENLQEHFKVDMSLTVRVYFTKEDFLPLEVQIKHGSEYIDHRGDCYVRFGGEFNRDLPSFEAFKHFIQFMYKFAEFSCIEKGESEVYFL